MLPRGKESQQHPALHWEEHRQQVKGGDPSPLLSTGEATSGVLLPVPRSPVHERHGATGESPAKGLEDD